MGECEYYGREQYQEQGDLVHTHTSSDQEPKVGALPFEDQSEEQQRNADQHQSGHELLEDRGTEEAVQQLGTGIILERGSLREDIGSGQYEEVNEAEGHGGHEELSHGFHPAPGPLWESDGVDCLSFSGKPGP